MPDVEKVVLTDLCVKYKKTIDNKQTDAAVLQGQYLTPVCRLHMQSYKVETRLLCFLPHTQF